jgi:serine/threonine-protein kinase RsbW
MSMTSLTDDLVDLTVGDVVLLDVPASPAYITVVRTAAAGLAARVDLTLDRIEDVRIAVDEACVMLVSTSGDSPDAEPATLTCEFTLEQESLAVEVSRTSTTLPEASAFVWSVLSALVDSLETGDDDGRTWVRLVVRRGPGAWS